MSGGRAGHILVVGAREEVVGKLVGLPVAISLLQRPGLLTPFEHRVAGRAFSVDFGDTETVLAIARLLHDRRPIDAVVSFTEPGLLPASEIAEQLSVRGNPRDAVLHTRDKLLMRSRLASAGVSPVRSRLAESPDDVAALLAECPDGVIVKPRDGTGSAGVSLVTDKADVGNAWAWCMEAGTRTGALVEEYLAGREFSVESMSAGGRHAVIALTAKVVTGPPHFVEIGHDLPAAVDAATRDEVVTCAVAALDALGHAWGPAHTEVVVGAAGARVVEVNTRVGGDRIWEMVEMVTGVDLVEASVTALLDERLPDPRRPRTWASVRFLQATSAGICVAVDGVDAALDVPGVVRVGDLARPGSVVSALRASDDRCGYALACAESGPAAARAADDAVAALTLRMLALP